jgi:hypothetical protein
MVRKDFGKVLSWAGSEKECPDSIQEKDAAGKWLRIK